jgi:HAD superfamily hydrolase (TIGR01490 family)
VIVHKALAMSQAQAPAKAPIRAALFDMDRTLLRRDTATLYVRYQWRNGQAGVVDVLRVAWWMAQYTAGVIDAPRVAERALSAYRGRSEAALAESCERWFEEDVRQHIAPGAHSVLQRHREAGDLLAIVTGSTPYAAWPVARALGIPHVLASELEVESGQFTGKVRSPMGYGAGKIVLAERLAQAHGFELREATFYSDSITDLPLLEHVRTPVAVNPDARLRRLARERGWAIEQW